AVRGGAVLRRADAGGDLRPRGALAGPRRRGDVPAYRGRDRPGGPRDPPRLRRRAAGLPLVVGRPRGAALAVARLPASRSARRRRPLRARRGCPRRRRVGRRGGGGDGMTAPALVGFYEPWWMQIAKAIVI